jgi:hypothetical protein
MVLCRAVPLSGFFFFFLSLATPLAFGEIGYEGGLGEVASAAVIG